MEIETNGISNFLGNTQSNQLKSATSCSKNQDVASVKVDCGALIDQAQKTPNTDPKKIQDASELLLSGQLESYENIILAAENIINFDI